MKQINQGNTKMVTKNFMTYTFCDKLFAAKHFITPKLQSYVQWCHVVKFIEISSVWLLFYCT